jgi:hypothetical protein
MEMNSKKGNQNYKQSATIPKRRPGNPHLDRDRNYNGNPNWKKGVSGNPKGRPPNQKMIPDNLREIGNCPALPEIVTELSKRCPSMNFTGMTMFQAYCWRVYINAVLVGENPALDFIAERTEGKIKQPIDLGFDHNKVQMAINITAENAPEPVIRNNTNDHVTNTDTPVQ